MRRFIVLGILLVLIAAACTQDAAMDEQPETSTTIQAASTTTTMPAELRQQLRAGPYESVGYSCAQDPTAGCDGDLRLNVTSLWIGTSNQGAAANDFIDFNMATVAVPDGFERFDLLGDVDDPVHAELGTGIRINQLYAPPAGLDVAGQAWMELTVSNASATDFADSQPAPGRHGPMRYVAPTDLDPIRVVPEDGTTQLIEEAVLVATTDDMMQWVIGFKLPGTYLIRASYWIGGAPQTLGLGFYRAEESSTVVPVTVSTTSAWDALPSHIRRLGWHFGTYASVGYSCGPDPAEGCDGDIDMSLVEVWVGDDPHHPVDFIDFYTEPQDDVIDRNADLLHEAGEADRDVFAESGWGLRVVQLESPPAGLDLGGSAWLELTASSVSASEFSTREPQPSSASNATVSKHRAPTSSEPTVIRPPPGPGNLIEEIVLAETTSDMMRWIVVLKHPGTYHYAAGYFLGGPIGTGNGLQILIRQN